MEFINDMPVTTKTDVKNHGYGVKSIKKAVEKYGGSVTWTLQNDEFEMKALIPIPA
jgi:sensor histidine kinase regulating citrate/malate metabolism